MKKLLLLISIILTNVLAVSATPIDAKQAMKIARTALVSNASNSARRAAMSNVEMKVILQDALQTDPAYYVCTPVSGEGFVIVSGDDSEDPIIGYSNEGKADAENMPPALRDLLNDYSHRIALVRQGVIEPTVQDEEAEEISTIAKVPSSVTSLCKSQWSQSSPFYNQCPISSTDTCLVGCIALSMAQVMCYYKYPTTGTGKVSTRASGAQVSSIDLDNTTFDYDNMINDYTDGYTAEQANAVSTLCLACGYASNMQYGVSVSGSYMENQCSALIKNFKYSSSTRIIVRTGALTDDTKWKKRLREELAAGRPIIISAYTESDYGHNFVCDGYTTTRFHINWGWGPGADGVTYNGQYNILTLIPFSWGEGFTKNQQFLIGIKPAVDGEDTFTQFFIAANDSVADYSANENTVSFTLPAFTNATASNLRGTLYYTITDCYGKEVGNCDISSLSINGKNSSSTQNASLIVPSDLADGNYYLSLTYKPNNSDAFQKIESWYNKTNLRITIASGQISDIKALTDDEMASDIATGIELVKTGEVMSEEYYNIAGQRVSNPQHGLFIKNGKKIIIK